MTNKTSHICLDDIGSRKGRGPTKWGGSSMTDVAGFVRISNYSHSIVADGFGERS